MVPVRALVPARPVVRSAPGLPGMIRACGSRLCTIDPQLTLKPECSPVNAYSLELVVDNGCMGLMGHAGERVLETDARLSRPSPVQDSQVRAPTRRNVPSRLPVLTAEPGTPSHDALRIPQLGPYEWCPTTRVRSTRDLMSSLSKT